VKISSLGVSLSIGLLVSNDEYFLFRTRFVTCSLAPKLTRQPKSRNIWCNFLYSGDLSIPDPVGKGLQPPKGQGLEHFEAIMSFWPISRMHVIMRHEIANKTDVNGRRSHSASMSSS
jgi:hypothetical protein